MPAPHSPVELNACAYAGLLLVRSKDEDDVLIETVEQSGGLDRVLRHCGVPREWGEKAMDAVIAHRGTLEGLDQLAQGSKSQL